MKWINLEVNRIVNCSACNHKMRLVLERSSKTFDPERDFLPNIILNVLSSPSNSVRIVDINPNFPNTISILVGQNPSKKVLIDPDDKMYELKIDDEFVSNYHCEVSVKILDNQIKVDLIDHDSLNGTYVRETRLKNRTELKHGDSFKIGNTILGLELNI